jgi:hypothetical protein
MELAKIDNVKSIRSAEVVAADLLIAKCLAAASEGCSSAYYDLGDAISTGCHGVTCVLIEAH